MFFWNFDTAVNRCLMLVFFFGFRLSDAVSNKISDALIGRANRTAVNKSSRIFSRPAKRDSKFSKSRQPLHYRGKKTENILRC